jgi:hypothetical protein
MDKMTEALVEHRRYMQHKTHMDWPRTEPQPPPLAAGDSPERRYAPELLHVHIDLDVYTVDGGNAYCGKARATPQHAKQVTDSLVVL